MSASPTDRSGSGRAKGDPSLPGLSVPDEADPDRRARSQRPDRVDERVRGRDRLAAQGGNDVARPQAGSGSRAAWGHGRDAALARRLNLSAVAGKALVQGRSDDRVGGMAGPDQLNDDPAGLVNGDGETQADVAALSTGDGVHAERVDRSIDADDLAAGVHERAAGVSGVDGGVSLDRVEEDPWRRAFTRTRLHGAVHCADDSAGHGVCQAKRRADGNDRIANLDAGRAAEAQGRKIGVARYLEHGYVGVRVAAHDLADSRLAVAEVHPERGVSGDPVKGHDMVVSDDVTAADDKSGPRTRVAVDLDHH